MNKKAFTLIEIILSLVIISMLAVYVISQLEKSRYNYAVTDTQNTLRELIINGIISAQGYASATGKRTSVANPTDPTECSNFHTDDNGCSPNYDFTCLDTNRLVQCKSWDQRFVVTGSVTPVVSPTWGSLSPLEDELMRQYGSCSVEVRVVSTNRNSFDIFVDCSLVDFNARSTEHLEDAVKFVFQENFADISVTIEDNAESMIDTTLLGDSEDGMIRARFEL